MGSRDETHPSFIGYLFGGDQELQVELILHNGQQLAPVVLSEVSENLQGGFHMLIGFLALSICLQMVCTGNVLFDSQHLTQLLKDLRCESCVSVRDYFLWYTHVQEYLLQI
jgi:hypothetical protein